MSETPQGHPDYKDLTEAKTRMANVAKEINDYTKRLDLGETQQGGLNFFGVYIFSLFDNEP